MHRSTMAKDTTSMSQRSFAGAEYAMKKKRTRREKFLGEMERIVPWARQIAVIEPPVPHERPGGSPADSASSLQSDRRARVRGAEHGAAAEKAEGVIPSQRQGSQYSSVAFGAKRLIEPIRTRPARSSV